MFGYITPRKPELRIREFEAYRGIYCGLCRQLGKEYGQLYRLTLNYDLVFLAMLQMAVEGKPVNFCRCRCMVHPLSKRSCCQSCGSLSYACAVSVLLCWHKLEDNIQDSPWYASLPLRLLRPLAHRGWKKAAQAQPELAEEMARQMAEQARLEREGCTSPDQAAEPTARIMEAVFARLSPDPVKKRVLERMGYLTGRWVYLMDALDDWEQDRRSGGYNPFLRAGLDREEAAAALRLTSAQLVLALDLLEPAGFGETLHNILELGLPDRVEAALKKQETPR